MFWQLQALVFIYKSSITLCWNPTLQRREVLLLGPVLPFVPITGYFPTNTPEHPFHYADDWIGTKLPILSLEDSAKRLHWDMGKWPDPILRIPAALVDMDRFQGTKLLRHACDELRKTAKVNGAVGLAAQQCGVNARLIYLIGQNAVLVNPQIVARSPEPEMRVWRESCLVLPPSFRATVLRDAWVSVEFQDWMGESFRRTFYGEMARAFQHEMDHDRGILITDHIDESEMDDVMRAIERPGRDVRIRQAFERYLG